MTAPKLRVIGNMDDQFHTAVSWEVQAIQDALASLAQRRHDRWAGRGEELGADLVEIGVLAQAIDEVDRGGGIRSVQCDD